MNFCSQCGQPVNLKIPEGDNRERHVCDHCETIHYQNPRIIAGCIPVAGDQVLLCRRAIEPRHGLWTLPAGFMENGETALEGALRECEEEANARINNPILSGIFDIPHINQVYMFYRGALSTNAQNDSIESGTDYSPGIESLEVELFRESEIPWDQLAFPVMELMLHHHFQDSKLNLTEVRTGTITRPWKSLRS
jgi:ADP-ribose pyrophosphatase YjhB (NUDIX family)